MKITAVNAQVNPVTTYPSSSNTSTADGTSFQSQDSGKVESSNELSREEKIGEKDEKEITREDINQLTDHLNKFMKSINTDLQFVIHEETNRIMVQFVDPKDQRVIKEFPPHELLDTLAAIRDYVGVLLDKRV